MHGNLLKNTAMLIGALAITWGGAADGFAQARKAAPAGGAAAAAQAGREIQVRKMELTQVKTPEYSCNVTEATTTANNWTRVLVRFDTETEWIDQLEMRFYIKAKNPKTGAYLIFTGTFIYSDVSKGRNHQVAVFLRPRTTDRYGIAEGAGVEVYSKGELVAMGSCPEEGKAWWRSAGIANMRNLEGYLLERSQTPFALIAVDNYEVMKGK